MSGSLKREAAAPFPRPELPFPLSAEQQEAWMRLRKRFFNLFNIFCIMVPHDSICRITLHSTLSCECLVTGRSPRVSLA